MLFDLFLITNVVSPAARNFYRTHVRGILAEYVYQYGRRL